jgi:HEAT repeat protein
MTVSGCTAPQPADPKVSPQEQAELEQRARDLLLRAARSDIDVIACNATESLVTIAPRDGLAAFRAAPRAESPLTRFAGYVALGDVRDKASMDLFRRGLDDAAARVRLAAAYAANRCGDSSSAPLLAYTLTDAQDENLRADAAWLIGRLGDKRTIKRLRAALDAPGTRKSTKVEVQVLGALAGLGDGKALLQLIEYARGPYDRLRRVLAVQALAEVAAPQAREVLLFRLRSTDDYLQTRLMAARGLGKLGDAEGYALAADSTHYADKGAADPEDETMRVRSLAALALGEIGQRRALPLLKTLAQSDDQRVQVAASFAICRICQR